MLLITLILHAGEHPVKANGKTLTFFTCKCTGGLEPLHHPQGRLGYGLEPERQCEK